MSLGHSKNRIRGVDWINDLKSDWVHCECVICGRDFKKNRGIKKNRCKYCCGIYNAHKKSFLHTEAKKRRLKDSNKCEICNEIKDLVLHHKDGNPENNENKNLILCCHNCHSKIHARYGRNKGNIVKKITIKENKTIEKLNKGVKNSFLKIDTNPKEKVTFYERKTSVLKRTNKLIKKYKTTINQKSKKTAKK